MFSKARVGKKDTSRLSVVKLKPNHSRQPIIGKEISRGANEKSKYKKGTA